MDNSADEWVYRMTAHNGGEFVDLGIFIPKFVECDETQALPLCRILVETLIGEELDLDRVGQISWERVADLAAIDRATPMKHLYDHLLSMLG